jgi:hypothetical protein
MSNDEFRTAEVKPLPDQHFEIRHSAVQTLGIGIGVGSKNSIPIAIPIPMDTAFALPFVQESQARENEP